MVKKIRIISLFVLLIILLTSCANDTQKIQPSVVNTNDTQSIDTTVKNGKYDIENLETRNFILAHTGSAGSTNDYWAETVKKLVEEKSNGKLTIDIYNSSQLGSDTDIAADVKAGAIDFHLSSPPAYANVVPVAAVFDMPFLFNNIEEARKAVRDEEFFNKIAEEYEKTGFHLFPFTDQGFRHITTNKEITNYDSFKGMSLRTMNNRHHIAFFTAMGVAATPLNTSEIYISLQQGMLDGQENPWSQVIDKKLYEVQDYITNSSHIYYIGSITMGNSNWNTLSIDAQAIITDAIKESVPIIDAYTDKVEEEARLKAISLGMTYIDFDLIEGLRDQLREATFEVAYKSIVGSIGNEYLDALLKAAGFEPPQI